MSPDSADVDFDAPPRWRFRFKLKTLFILMALVAIWLTIHVIRDRQADAAISAVSAVYGRLADACEKPPDGTRIAILHPLTGFRGAVQSNNWATAHGRYVDSRTVVEQLNLANSLASLPMANIDRLLCDHFMEHLAQFEVIPNSDTDSAAPNPIEFEKMWHDPNRPDFTIAMHVIHSVGRPLATVIVQAEVDQPLAGGRFGAFLLGFFSNIVAALIVLVALRSMLGWGWSSATAFSKTREGAHAGLLASANSAERARS
jgi:hypothetical protein